MVRRFITFAVVLFTAACVAGAASRPAAAETRIALVIGNGAYKTLPQLPNPPHDAIALGESLEGLGFEVDLGLDQTRDQMDEAIIRFARKARQADVALVFFGGHGIQYNGINYLAPVDVQVNDELDLRRLATAQDLVGDLQAAKNVRILILDASHDSKLGERMANLRPSSRAAAFAGGLAPMEKTAGTLIASAAQPNTLAEDGAGAHSPFTSALLKHLPEAGLDARLLFMRASAEVYEETGYVQLPEVSEALVGKFQFKRMTAPDPATDTNSKAAAYFAFAKSVGTIEAWDEFSRKYPAFYPQIVAAERKKLRPSYIVRQVQEPAPSPLWPWPVKTSVADRAAILVEAPDEPSKVKTYVGSVVWRLDDTNYGAGHPPGPVVRAEVDIPEAKLKASMIFEKNFDAGFKASHTMKLAFTLAPDSPIGSIKEIKVPQLRGAQAQAGNPLSGVSVLITDNYFLVGFFRGASESANLELIKRREWFDVPMVLKANGRIAKLTFEKDANGARVIEDALAAWQQPQSTNSPEQPLDKATADTSSPEGPKSSNDE
jgi:hypothetical protein